MSHTLGAGKSGGDMGDLLGSLGKMMGCSRPQGKETKHKVLNYRCKVGINIDK